MTGKRITKKNNEIEKEQFGVKFIFNFNTNNIDVLRISGTDKLTEIYIGMKLNYEQFKDECVCWCDRNAA